MKLSGFHQGLNPSQSYLAPKPPEKEDAALREPAEPRDSNSVNTTSIEKPLSTVPARSGCFGSIFGAGGPALEHTMAKVEALENRGLEFQRRGRILWWNTSWKASNSEQTAKKALAGKAGRLQMRDADGDWAPVDNVRDLERLSVLHGESQDPQQSGSTLKALEGDGALGELSAYEAWRQLDADEALEVRVGDDLYEVHSLQESNLVGYLAGHRSAESLERPEAARSVAWLARRDFEVADQTLAAAYLEPEAVEITFHNVELGSWELSQPQQLAQELSVHQSRYQELNQLLGEEGQLAWETLSGDGSSIRYEERRDSAVQFFNSDLEEPALAYRAVVSSSEPGASLQQSSQQALGLFAAAESAKAARELWSEVAGPQGVEATLFELASRFPEGQSQAYKTLDQAALSPTELDSFRSVLRAAEEQAQSSPEDAFPLTQRQLSDLLTATPERAAHLDQIVTLSSGLSNLSAAFKAAQILGPEASDAERETLAALRSQSDLAQTLELLPTLVELGLSDSPGGATGFQELSESFGLKAAKRIWTELNLDQVHTEPQALQAVTRLLSNTQDLQWEGWEQEDTDIGLAWSDSPGGNYQANDLTKLTSVPLDLGGATRVQVKAYAAHQIENGHDKFRIAYLENGRPLQQMETKEPAPAKFHSLEATSTGGRQPHIRLELESDGSNEQDGVHLAYVEVWGDGKLIYESGDPTAARAEILKRIQGAPGERVQELIALGEFSQSFEKPAVALELWPLLKPQLGKPHYQESLASLVSLYENQGVDFAKLGAQTLAPEVLAEPTARGALIELMSELKEQPSGQELLSKFLTRLDSDPSTAAKQLQLMSELHDQNWDSALALWETLSPEFASPTFAEDKTILKHLETSYGYRSALEIREHLGAEVLRQPETEALLHQIFQAKDSGAWRGWKKEHTQRGLAFSDSPNGVYGNKISTSLKSDSIQLGSHSKVTLEILSEHELEDGYDHLTLEVRGRRNSQSLAKLTGSAPETVHTFDLSTYQGQKVQFDLKLTSDNSGQRDGVKVHNLRLWADGKILQEDGLGGANRTELLKPAASFSSEQRLQNLKNLADFVEQVESPAVAEKLWPTLAPHSMESNFSERAQALAQVYQAVGFEFAQVLAETVGEQLLDSEARELVLRSAAGAQSPEEREALSGLLSTLPTDLGAFRTRLSLYLDLQSELEGAAQVADTYTLLAPRLSHSDFEQQKKTIVEWSNEFGPQNALALWDELGVREVYADPDATAALQELFEHRDDGVWRGWEFEDGPRGPAYSDSPGGVYENQSSTTLTSSSINLAESGATRFEFRADHELEGEYDPVEVMVRRNGQSWATLAKLSGQARNQLHRFDLSSHNGSEVELALKLSSDNSGQRDGIQVSHLRVWSGGKPVVETGNADERRIAILTEAFKQGVDHGKSALLALSQLAKETGSPAAAEALWPALSGSLGQPEHGAKAVALTSLYEDLGVDLALPTWELLESGLYTDASVVTSLSKLTKANGQKDRRELLFTKLGALSNKPAEATQQIKLLARLQEDTGELEAALTLFEVLAPRLSQPQAPELEKTLLRWSKDYGYLSAAEAFQHLGHLNIHQNPTLDKLLDQLLSPSYDNTWSGWEKELGPRGPVFSDSPGTLYSDRAEYILESRRLQLPADGRIKFQVVADHELEGTYDPVRVEFAISTGGWRTLSQITDVGQGTVREHDLSQLAGETVQLRLRLTTDSSGRRDGMKVQSLRLYHDGQLFSSTGVADSAAINTLALATDPDPIVCQDKIQKLLEFTDEAGSAEAAVELWPLLAARTEHKEYETQKLALLLASRKAGAETTKALWSNLEPEVLDDPTVLPALLAGMATLAERLGEERALALGPQLAAEAGSARFQTFRDLALDMGEQLDPAQLRQVWTHLSHGRSGPRLEQAIRQFQEGLTLFGNIEQALEKITADVDIAIGEDYIEVGDFQLERQD